MQKSKMWWLRVVNSKLNVAVAGWESQTNMFQAIWSEMWRLRVGTSNFNNIFQAIRSEMWRLRVVNLKVQCNVSGGLVRNVAVAGWVSQTTVLCFKWFGPK